MKLKTMDIFMIKMMMMMMILNAELKTTKNKQTKTNKCTLQF